MGRVLLVANDKSLLTRTMNCVQSTVNIDQLLQDLCSTFLHLVDPQDLKLREENEIIGTQSSSIIKISSLCKCTPGNVIHLDTSTNDNKTHTFEHRSKNKVDMAIKEFHSLVPTTAWRQRLAGTNTPFRLYTLLYFSHRFHSTHLPLCRLRVFNNFGARCWIAPGRLHPTPIVVSSIVFFTSFSCCWQSIACQGLWDAQICHGNLQTAQNCPISAIQCGQYSGSCCTLLQKKTMLVKLLVCCWWKCKMWLTSHQLTPLSRVVCLHLLTFNLMQLSTLLLLGSYNWAKIRFVISKNRFFCFFCFFSFFLWFMKCDLSVTIELSGKVTPEHVEFLEKSIQDSPIEWQKVLKESGNNKTTISVQIAWKLIRLAQSFVSEHQSVSSKWIRAHCLFLFCFFCFCFCLFFFW